MRWRRGAPADVLTRAFVLLMAVVTLAQARIVTEWPWLLAGDALSLVLLELLERARGTGRLAAVVALWYPYLLVSAYYGQLGVIGLDAARVHDHTIQHLESALFGGQPSLAWNDRMVAPVFAWIFNLGYLAHYGIIIAVPLWLWIRAGRAASERAVFAVALTFYLCFACYALYPVAGPGYVFPPVTGPVSEVLPARLVRAVLEGGSSYGTAFPSSHVAASWCAVLVCFRDARRLAIGLAPVALLLAAGTVYGQYHYAVDALAGGVMAVLGFTLAERLRPRLAERPS